MNKPFHEKLKCLRKLRGLTLQKLADDAGVTKSYVWDLENPKPYENARPSAAVVIDLAKSLGVSPMALLGQEPNLTIVGKMRAMGSSMRCEPISHGSINQTEEAGELLCQSAEMLQTMASWLGLSLPEE